MLIDWISKALADGEPNSDREIPAIPPGFGCWGLGNPNWSQVVGAPHGARFNDLL